MLFAIVDIETTGGNANNSGITEIAIIITDGKQVVDSYESLVDPGMYIPPFITGLTGITNAMVENAPSFTQIAPKVHEMLEGKIFVAHNVNFDYSFVKKGLEDNGFIMPTHKLCTVRYGRVIDPGHRSYSLANLCARHEISNDAAHRAMGDTHATTLLFHKLLLKDPNKLWQEQVYGKGKIFKLPSNLNVETFTNLPEKPGVYYIKDGNGKNLYIGKAKNIKSRINQHFTGDLGSKKTQIFEREVYDVKYTLTGSEFLALLFEDTEIRKYWPPLNKAQKTNPVAYHISYYEDQNNNWRLGIIKGKQVSQKLATVYSQNAAREILHHYVKENSLNPELCQVNGKFNADISVHNSNLMKLITHTKSLPSNFVVWEDGRTQDESGFILIRDSSFYGYGFIPKVKMSTNYENLLPFTTTIKASSFTSRYIQSYLLDSKEKSIAVIEYPVEGLLF